MLYDQAQIVLACLEAAQAGGDPFFAQIAEDTLQYVRRDMAGAEGGFYSAEDADSLDGAEKVEGAFYVWTADEVASLLGQDGAAFQARYGVLPNGNAPFDPHGEFINKNLLYTAQSISDIARTVGRTPVEVAESLLRARQVLFNARAGRPRPLLDDKVLTAWNGLMIAAFARAARVLGGGLMGEDNEADPTAAHLASATRAATFIRDVMWDARTGRLLRRYRGGDAAIDAYAEDYAYLIFGILELFQASGDPQWLAWARDLQRRQDALFWDDDTGGYFSTTGTDSSVLVRMKEDYDGAEPAPTSVSAMNLLTLAHLTGESSYQDRADSAIASFGGRLAQMGRAVPFMAAALSVALAPSEQIVIVGRPGADDTNVMWTAANRRYRPFTVLTQIDPDRQAALAEHLPWTKGMTMMNGQATAYVCRGFTCESPSTDPGVLQ